MQSACSRQSATSSRPSNRCWATRMASSELFDRDHALQNLERMPIRTQQVLIEFDLVVHGLPSRTANEIPVRSVIQAAIRHKTALEARHVDRARRRYRS